MKTNESKMAKTVIATASALGYEDVTVTVDGTLERARHAALSRFAKHNDISFADARGFASVAFQTVRNRTYNEAHNACMRCDYDPALCIEIVRE